MLKCPDCGEKLNEVLVERTQTKTFKVDPEKKTLVPVYPNLSWDDDDYSYRCPNCDSLNINELLIKYEVKEV